ncbi:MAG: hypothetical protein CM1200mP14_27660 [Gammaproteobacteria bacterium]|nr:MAG: hypothetical protein CM1200mP14_27660 [Gammaproteobacteria bacterium]
MVFVTAEASLEGRSAKRSPNFTGAFTFESMEAHDLMALAPSAEAGPVK